MKLAKTERRDSGQLSRMPKGSSFGPLSRLRDEIDRLFEAPFGRWFPPATDLFEGWSPAVDVYEDKNNVFVKAELPGLKKEDIQVSAYDGVLHVSGERKEEAERKEASGYRAERYFGRFERNISLPKAVQGDNIRAEYKDGILTVICPK